jgi:hypothetical protein
MKLRGTLLLGILSLVGCTDAEMARLGAYGNEHTVTLYSGGKPVREWTSTGKVKSEQNSDGYFFEDKATGRLVRVTGDLVIQAN